MKNRNTSTFRNEWKRTADRIKDESQRLMFYEAIIGYLVDEKEPDVDDSILALVSIPFEQIESDFERKKEISEKRSVAGRKHSGNQWNKMEQTQNKMEQNGTNGTSVPNYNITKIREKEQEIRKIEQNEQKESKEERKEVKEIKKERKSYAEERECVKNAHTCTHTREDLTPEQNMLLDEYDGFTNWLKNTCPYISNPDNMRQIEGYQYSSLRKMYSKKQLADILEKIENRVDCRVKYSSLYITVKNWISNEERQQ